MLQMNYYDLISYCQTNKVANEICNDPLFWNTKGKQDFNVDNIKSKNNYFTQLDYIDMDNYNVKDILKRWIDRLIYLESLSKYEYEMYFYIFDELLTTRTSEFMKQMFNLEICCLAKDFTVGSNLCYLMNILFHDKYMYFVDDLNDTIINIKNEDVEGPLTISLLMKIHSELFDDSVSYILSINNPKTIFKDFYDTETNKHYSRNIKVVLDNIDAWTLKRISNELDKFA
jgi:hypothetical protein